MQVDGVEYRAPNVVLRLLISRVSDANRPRTLVAGKVGKRLLRQVPLTPDGVHDLELGDVAAHICDEVEEVVGLAVEPEGVETPERKSRIPDPGVAVVPITFPLRCLRQRSRRGRSGIR